jgi:serine/threonine protein kinase
MKYSEGDLMDGRYVLKQFIGSGSFGEVWLAQDNQTELDVAIKIYVSMDMQGLSDFKKEFQLSFNLNHTNLLHANYLGVSPQDNRPYLVMPFCPEGSVSKCAGKFDEQQMWKFIRDVASGLAYLHDQRPPIIHQDIKLDNILILKNGDYVISDFGISKQLKKTLTRSVSHMNSAGAIAYMGPERFSKQYQAVKASDIWSLGVTIYELITCDMPFCGMGGSMQKQGADIPELPGEFSENMQILFAACLAKETWDRPSAREIVEYAEKCMRGETPVITWTREPTEPHPSAAMNNSGSYKATARMNPLMETNIQSNEHARQYAAVSSSGATYRYNMTESAQTFNWVIYLAASVIGLVVGIVLNVLMK